VEFFMGPAAGNATKAALMAGYSEATARKQGSRLLTFVDIQRAIDERANSDPVVWTREDRQRFWTAVASGAPGYQDAPLRDRLKASELLGRSQADFTDKGNNRGTDLGELIAEVARRRREQPPGNA
jgi:phage terminase small subunit